MRARSGWSLVTLALALALALGLSVAFSFWSVDARLSFPRFLLAFAFLFVFPGSRLVRWWRLEVSPLEHALLATVLGMIAAIVLYASFAWVGQAWLLWLWVFAGALGLPGLLRGGRRVFGRGLGALRRSHALLLLALGAGWVPLVALSYYFRNLARTGSGALSYVDMPDILLHASIAAELTHTFPPQVPFIAGERLNYHVGMDLVAAVLNRFGGVPIPDLLVRYCPALFVTVGMLAVFCLARRLTGSGAAAAAAAALAVLGEDLSFVPGLLRRSPSVWCADYFQAPTIFSQYCFNPMVMAHGLLFAALFCLQRSLEDRRWGWIAASSICAAALMQTKIFAFAHLALAIGAAGAVHLARFRRLELLRQAAGIVAASLPFLLYMAVTNRGGGQFVWVLSSPGTYVTYAFKQAQWPVLLAVPGLGVLAYLVLTFGFRAVGFGELFRALRPRRGQPFPLLLAAFVLLGPLLTLTTKVVPRDALDSYNNSIWFLVASKYVATLFAVAALAKFWQRSGAAGRGVAAALVAFVALASTVQFMRAMPRLYPLGALGAPEVETVGYLNGAALPGDVVLSPIDPALLALSKLRSPYYSLFDLSFVNGAIVSKRKQDVAAFWESWKRGAVRGDVLDAQRVDWVVGANAAAGASGPAAAKAEEAGLRQVFANAAFTVYRVQHPRAGGAPNR
jgi:hypothetical protein